MKYHLAQNDIISFGYKVKQIRKAKKLSQEELANLCDFEISQISRIERGIINTSIGNVFILAKHLGVHPTTFFEE